MGKSTVDPVQRKKDFGKRLAQLIAEKNINASELSRALGRDESYITHIENGHFFPSMDMFLDICDFLCVLAKDFWDTELLQRSRSQTLSTVIETLPEDKKGIIIDLLVSWDALEKPVE